MIKEEIMKWYTVKVQSNREKNTSERIKIDMKRDFNEDINVLIPSQKVLQHKDGKKVEKINILYPGYIFVETKSIDKLNHIIKSTIGALSVLTNKKGEPSMLRQSEIDKMIGNKEESTIQNDCFQQGEKILILNGPFQNFKGTIENIDIDKNKVKIGVMIFDRKSIVDLTIDDIIKNKD